MRYAQIVMGLHGNGKSTYCKLMAKYAESRGRRFRIVNMDAGTESLEYEDPIADVRDVIPLEEYLNAERKFPGAGAGFELTLTYVVDHPEWLVKAMTELLDGDFIMFDCPGQENIHAHVKSLKVFAAMLVVKNIRACGVFVKDARQALNGYAFIASSLTPLASYINLSIPHLCVMMKVDMLSDLQRNQLQIFINSEVKDILRYENCRVGETNDPEQCSLMKAAASAAYLLEGHNLVRKKYFIIDIRDEHGCKGFLQVLDDVMGINQEDS